MPYRCYVKSCKTMNLSEYIESGVLQEYCLGLLTDKEKSAVEENCRQYPAIKSELEAFQSSLQDYVSDFNMHPPAGLQSRIWTSLENINLEERGDIHDLPYLDKYTDYKKWLKIVRPMLPAQLEQDM